MTRIKVNSQHHDWDCGVSALSMLLDVPYGDVAKVVKENIHDPKLKTRGLILRQLEQIIHIFGFKTRRVYRKDGYLEHATGILGMNHGLCGPHGHWVVVKDGIVLDPSGGEAWSLDDYLTAGRCKPATLLVID